VTPGNTYTINVGQSGAGGTYSTNTSSGYSGGGGLRIVWPGTTRQFPSTNVSTTTNETVTSG
jgi:hypothetical protein